MTILISYYLVQVRVIIFSKFGAQKGQLGPEFQKHAETPIFIVLVDKQCFSNKLGPDNNNKKAKLGPNNNSTINRYIYIYIYFFLLPYMPTHTYYIYIYICMHCGVINWAKFGGFQSYYLGQVRVINWAKSKLLTGPRSFSHYKLGVLGDFFAQLSLCVFLVPNYLAIV